MIQAKFMEKYVYALSSDFKAEDGTPAAWAPNMPSHWGSESNILFLDTKSKDYEVLALSGDDSLLAAAVRESIYIFSVADLELRAELVGHTEAIDGLEFVPKSRTGYTLVSSTNKVIIIWELNDEGEDLNAQESFDTDGIARDALESTLRELRWEFESEASKSLESNFKINIAAAVAQKGLEKKTVIKGSFGSFGSDVFSWDGKYMFTLLHNDSTQQGMRAEELLPCIEVRHLETMELIHQLRGHTDSIMWIGASPDSKKLATVAWDGTVRIWSLHSGSCFYTLGSFGGQMWAGAWSPDSKYLAFSQGSPDTIIYVYDTMTGKQISKYSGFKKWVRSIAWSPEGKHLAAGSRDATVVVYDPMTGIDVNKWEHEFCGQDPELMKALLSAEFVQFVGWKLLFKTSEGTVEVYDFETNLKSQFTRGPEDKVSYMVYAGIRVSHDGKFFISKDADDALRFWNL